MKKTQKERVIDILNQQGYIDNYFCVNTKLTLRLGAIIHVLKKEGWKFSEESGFIEGTKNWVYRVLEKPVLKLF